MSLSELIGLSSQELQEVLRVSAGEWNSLLFRVATQERLQQRDFADEQVWTFLVACGFASAGPSGAYSLAEILCEGQIGSGSTQEIWMEACPIPPRMNEGNTCLDLALGAVADRGKTISGIRCDSERTDWICFCECKWYSDISTDVSRDHCRNQLARVIENAVTFQRDSGTPAVVHVSLVTPQLFKNAPVKSRLYAYKFAEYGQDWRAIERDLKECKLICRDDRDFKYPKEDFQKRLAALKLHWVTFEDLFAGMPATALSASIKEFAGAYNGSQSKH